MKRRFTIAMLATALCLAAPPVLAASATGSYLKVSARAQGATQAVTLELNKSMILDLPQNASEVIVSQPGIAQAIMRTKTRAILQGIASGSTNIIFLGADGAAVAVLDITVGGQSDVGAALEAALAQTIPGSRIRVQSVQAAGGGAISHVVLTGSVRSQDDAAKAVLIAGQYAGGDTNVANVLQIAGNQQVVLKVTVAEVDRTVVKQLGINLDVSSGGLITSIVNSPNTTLGDVSGATPLTTISAGATLGPLSISATLKALERRNALRTLAEPTLTAMSGQPAEFLVGGETPYNTSDGNGHVIVAFKEYGVKLNFTPTVKSNGLVGLLIDTNVSEPAGGGAITERGAKTTVELPVGCTLAIGGLLQENEKHELAQMPGLGDIPILGALFRSRDYIHEQTELVIMVTPTLADLGRPDLPTDDYPIAGDAEAIFLGHLEKQYGVGTDGMRGGYQGSVGFVLD
jgi:pilus assembly protein CpaC